MGGCCGAGGEGGGSDVHDGRRRVRRAFAVIGVGVGAPPVHLLVAWTVGCGPALPWRRLELPPSRELSCY